MAKLPQYTQQAVRRATQSQTPTIQVAPEIKAAGEFTEGAAKLYAVRKQMQEREARTYATEVKNQNTIEFSQYKVDLAREAKSGDEYLKGITEYLDNQKQKALDNASSKKAAEFAGAYFGQFEASAQSEAIQIAAKMNADRAKNAFKNSLDIAKTSIYLDPSQTEAQVKGLVTELALSDIPESQKPQIITDVTKDLNRSRILGVINQNPYEAVNILSQSNEGLSAADHEVMLNKAISEKEQHEREVQAEMSRNERAVDELQSRIESETAKNGFEMVQSNDLSLEWITSNRNNLSESDYKYFLNNLENPGQKITTDVNVYSDLYSKAITMPQAAMTEAHEALINKQITISDFNRIMTVSNQADSGDLPSAYKQSASYLRSVSRTNELNPPVGAGERFANSTNDFNIWFEKNPDATPQEAVNKAKEIWADYALVEGPAIVTAPRPYMSEKNKSDIKMQDLSESAKKLKADFTNGTISQEEYRKQQQIILKWKRDLEGKNG